MSSERDTQEQCVALGRITKPQGLRGELRLKLYNPESDLLWQHSTWTLDCAGAVRSVEGRQVRMLSDDVAVVSIEGIGSRGAADELRGAEVALPLRLLPATAEDEWYVRDLIGLAVVGEQGDELGRVLDLIAYPSVDCLLIETPEGRFEVPMVEPYLDRVELDNRRVVVRSLSDLEPVAGALKKSAADDEVEAS